MIITIAFIWRIEKFDPAPVELLKGGGGFPGDKKITCSERTQKIWMPDLYMQEWWNRWLMLGQHGGVKLCWCGGDSWMTPSILLALEFSSLLNTFISSIEISVVVHMVRCGAA